MAASLQCGTEKYDMKWLVFTGAWAEHSGRRGGEESAPSWLDSRQLAHTLNIRCAASRQRITPIGYSIGCWVLPKSDACSLQHTWAARAAAASGGGAPAAGAGAQAHVSQRLRVRGDQLAQLVPQCRAGASVRLAPSGGPPARSRLRCGSWLVRYITSLD